MIQMYHCSCQIPTINPFFLKGSKQITNITPSSLTQIGTYQLDKTWNAGKVYLANGDSLIGYYLRYDLMKNHLEIIVETKIKAINADFIDHFEWFSVTNLRKEKFISKKHTAFDNPASMPAFVELKKDGNAKLLKSTKYFAPLESTSPSLVNDTDQNIQLLENYYVSIADQVFEIVGSKKRNLRIFNSIELNEFVKEKNLKFNNPNDLERIVDFFNGQKKGHP